MSAAIRRAAAAAGRVALGRPLPGGRHAGVVTKRLVQYRGVPARSVCTQTVGESGSVRVTRAGVAAVAHGRHVAAAHRGRNASSAAASNTYVPPSHSGGTAPEAVRDSGGGGNGSRYRTSGWRWTGRALAVLAVATGAKVAHAVAPLCVMSLLCHRCAFAWLTT